MQTDHDRAVACVVVGVVDSVCGIGAELLRSPGHAIHAVIGIRDRAVRICPALVNLGLEPELGPPDMLPMVLSYEKSIPSNLAKA